MDTLELSRRIRRHSIEMTHLSKGSHIASILSVADIVAVLYNDVMNIYPTDPKNPKRDRFILSKGHAGGAIYAALAEKGFFDSEILKTHCQDGSNLSGHVSHKNVPGVEFSTGSLGHGLGVGCGIAMALKQNRSAANTYVVMGDGECEEGSVWEAALFASAYKLNNLTLIIDHNKLQSFVSPEETIAMRNIAKKWDAFDWDVYEIDGHNIPVLKETLLKPAHKNKPRVIVAHTVKGKGVSFMENNILWHYRDPQGEFYQKAIEELGDI